MSTPPSSNNANNGNNGITGNNGNTGNNGTFAIFLASFMTLIAAGIGFSVRGAILEDWSAAFGFTKSQLGEITGGGLVGFGITIILLSLIADRVGYRPLMVLAFLLHVASAVVTYAAQYFYDSMPATTPDEIAARSSTVFNCLWYGAFLFSLGNGTCEAVINPLVATLYPKQKTHYLNILHAGWPGGLILGGLLAFAFVGKSAAMPLHWTITSAFFLPFVLYYGFVVLTNSFPKSETQAAGVSFRAMLTQLASPILLFLFFLHACVGYVELGTDGWITNIMKTQIPNSVLLLVWTSGLMFVLRFFAGPIVERINPLGLLFASAVLGMIGLYWLGTADSIGPIFLAGTVYGIGKTFLWPTMLGVVGERFPKGGALTMGMIGGIGMLSAGLLGGPMIGWKQDKFASEKLQETPTVYEQYKADNPSSPIKGIVPEVTGLNGTKVEEILNKKKEDRTEDEQKVFDASLYGGRMALKWTAAVPATMAVGYLLLVLYFAATGGYKQQHILDVETKGPSAS
jgi:MFS family permease